MCIKITPLYHRCISSGPDAGSFYVIPFRTSAYAVERAQEEQDRLRAAGHRVVPAPTTALPEARPVLRRVA
jgi:hypothetical protein